MGRGRGLGDEVAAAARRLAFCRAFLAFFFAFAWSPGCGPPWEPVRGLPCTEPPGCGLLCGWPPDCGLPAGRGYTSVDVVEPGGPMSVASTSAGNGCARSPRFECCEHWKLCGTLSGPQPFWNKNSSLYRNTYTHNTAGPPPLTASTARRPRGAAGPRWCARRPSPRQPQPAASGSRL